MRMALPGKTPELCQLHLQAAPVPAPFR